MNQDNDANRNALPPHGNPNFPTNPPPVVANPPYQYGVHPMPQLPQPHQMPYYNPPQFVPMMAPPMQQQWPLGHQQPVQQMMQQWPYGQPTNLQQAQWPQSPIGYVAPSNVPQSPYYYNVQQQQTPVPTSSSPPQQWNVNAPEFVPRHVLNGDKEATLETVQDVISLGAPARNSHVSSEEHREYVSERSTLTEGSVSVANIDHRVSALTLKDNVDPERATTESSVTLVKEEVVEQGECSATHTGSLKSQRKEKKKQQEEAKRHAKMLKEEADRKDAAALERAFADNAGYNSEKDEYKESLMKYARTEKERRSKFQKKKGSKHPVVHWMLMDISLFLPFLQEKTKLQYQLFFDQLIRKWFNFDSKEGTRPEWMAAGGAFKDCRDEVVHHDFFYMAQMNETFPEYKEFLQCILLNLIFVENVASNLIPQVTVNGTQSNSTIVLYLTRHSRLRYTDDKSEDKLSPMEIKTITAFKENPYSGVTMMEAKSFFLQKALAYFTHSDRATKPFIERNALVFRFLASIPSPILAFDASFCLTKEPMLDMVSDTRYAIMVMGNDAVPPYRTDV